MQFLYEFGLFASEFVFSAIAVIVVFAVIASTVKALKSAPELNTKEKLKFTNLLDESRERREAIEDAVFEYDVSSDEKDKKKKLKQKKKELKDASSKEREERNQRIKELEEHGEFCPEKVFVMDFDGDTHAAQVKDLIKKTNAILDVATDKDEVIIKLDSPGGVVNGYGLCSSVLERIRSKGIHLTVCVDSVAASGGYLMSCVADKIVAAPFAYIGSIGVVASIPNFNRVLKKNEVDYEQVTAGKYKRTLTIFGENTPEGREKFKSELEAIHGRFKEIVLKYRPNIDIDNIATGEYWLARDALARGLIDELNTFDAYLQNTLEKTKLCAIKISIEVKEKKSLKDFLTRFFSARAWTRAVKEEVEESMHQDNYSIR